MRKSFDTLSALVLNEMKRELLSGELFVFVGKRRTRAKVLYWDGTGLCVLAKRLEQGRFAAVWRDDRANVELSPNELALLLEGSEVVGRMRLSPAPLELVPAAA
jgi:transposase